MKGHNHAWQIEKVVEGGFTAKVMDRDKALDDKIATFQFDAKCKFWRDGKKADAANAKAGLHTTAMPLLHERRIAAIGYDGDGETVPSNCEGVRYPIHAIGIVAMGMYFMDSLQFEDLAAACEAEGRNEFMCVIAPLRLAGGTGCPVNPIAIF